jgi:WD repeat-containing protein 26
MLADGDGTTSNGTSRGYSNGTAAASRAASTNGTHKLGVVKGTLDSDKEMATLPPVAAPYFGHDREEVTRILIQALSDMGYQTQAEGLSRASGHELESPTVAAFRSAVLAGSWADAEDLLSGAVTADDQDGKGNGLVLAPGSDRNYMRFWIREQKFLELLEQRDTSRALTVLRSELTPLFQDTQKLHFLSTLLMCESAEDVKAKTEWDGAVGQSRRVLLSDLSSTSLCVQLYLVQCANMSSQNAYRHR